MKLSFSTRGWPNLSFDEMLDVAVDMGFSGVEVYDLTKFEDSLFPALILLLIFHLIKMRYRRQKI